MNKAQTNMFLKQTKGQVQHISTKHLAARNVVVIKGEVHDETTNSNHFLDKTFPSIHLEKRYEARQAKKTETRPHNQL